MALIRMIVGWKRASDPPRDICTNTLYFEHQGDLIDPVDWQDLTDDVWTVYQDTAPVSGMTLDVRSYDMGDAEPRPIKAQKTGAITGTVADGDREVALCLSYYGERNLPRQRGRIYLGPWSASRLKERPETVVQQMLISLGQGLAGIGGENVSWRVYSPTSGEHHHIRHIWVNNEWDVLRSRGLRETARVTADV